MKSNQFIVYLELLYCKFLSVFGLYSAVEPRIEISECLRKSSCTVKATLYTVYMVSYTLKHNHSKVYLVLLYRKPLYSLFSSVVP